MWRYERDRYSCYNEDLYATGALLAGSIVNFIVSDAVLVSEMKSLAITD